MADKITFNTDYTLFNAYMRGNKDAGEKLCKNAYPVVYGYVQKQSIKFPSLVNYVDDIVCEAFLRSIDERFVLKKDSKYSTFIIGFAQKIILEYKKRIDKEIKKTISINEQLDSFDKIEDFHLENRNPLHILIEKEKSDEIKKIFEQLPEDYQQIIILRIFNRVKSKDIAQIMGKSESAVNSLYCRAIKKFKEIYFSSTNF